MLAHLADATIVIMAAAVADYRPVAPQARKIKRGGRAADPRTRADAGHSGRRLARAKAIASWSASPPRPITSPSTPAAKLAAKAADLIVANDVTADGAGFDHDTNVVTLFTRDGARDASAAHEQARRRPAHPRPGFGASRRACRRRPRQTVPLRPNGPLIRMRPGFFAPCFTEKLEAWLRYYDDLGIRSVF